MATLHRGPTAHQGVPSRRSVPEPVSTASAVKGEDRPRLSRCPCASPNAHGAALRHTRPPWSGSTVATMSTGRAVRRGGRHILQADRGDGRAVTGTRRRAARRHVRGRDSPRHTSYRPVGASGKNPRLPQRADGHGYSMQKEAGAFPPA